MAVDDLYQEIIFDHYRRPRNKGHSHDCGSRVKQDNPVCGDEIELCLQLQDGRIQRASFEGQGCAISQASASMMAEALQGRSVEEALRLGAQMRELMQGQLPEGDLGDLAALAGVASFPVRIKCALLPWSALEEALTRR